MAAISAVSCSATPISVGVGGGGQTAAEAGQAGGAGTERPGGAAGLGGSAGEGAAGAAGEAGRAGALATVWNEHSQHVELDCFGFFSGSMQFSADRAQLSVEQIRALEDMRGGGDCGSDGLGCNVTLTSDRGDVLEYNALQYGLCEEAVAPVLAELGCKFAMQSVEALSPSTGCFHGMHETAGPIHQQLFLPEANRNYHVEVGSCRANTVTLELFGSDPSVPLAVGMPVAEPGPRGTCVALELQVQAPMFAELVITPQAGEGNDGGDLLLNFR